MKRLWKVLRWCGIGLMVLIGLGLIWFSVASAQANGRIEERVAAIRKAGEPISLAELARKPIAAETNAKTYLDRARPRLKEFEQKYNSAEGKATEAQRESFYAGKAGGPVYDLAKKLFAEYPDVVPLLEQAAACEDYDSQMDYTLPTQAFLEQDLEHFQLLRSAARVLSYQANLNLAEGRPADALANGIAIVKLSRHYHRDPLIVGHLVAIAVRGVGLAACDQALRVGPLPERSYQDLDAELARHDLPAYYRHALVTDRAYGLSHFADQAVHAIAAYLKTPIGKNDAADYLDLFAAMLADGPRVELSQNTKAVLDRSGGLTKGMASAIQATGEATVRSQAQLRSLRVLSAIKKRELAGELDAVKLDELGLPNDVLIDPYNQGPILVKKLPSGWTVYTVGKNLKDDGGMVKDLSDIGFGE